MSGGTAWERGAACLLALVILAGTASCRRKRDGDGSASLAPPCAESYAPAGSMPPVAVSLEVGVSENVTLDDLQSLYTRFVAVNLSLWNVTEGQIRIGRLRIFDNTHPGTTSSQWSSLDLSNVDIVAWPPQNFDGPGISFVAAPNSGRCGRFMGIPWDVANEILLHEFGHFLYQLSWTAGPILVDEYETAPDDSACIQELRFTPLRWCWTDNHRTQASQPRSCWEQVLMDYPAFTFSNTNVAPSPPPDPEVEYTDAP